MSSGSPPATERPDFAALRAGWPPSVRLGTSSWTYPGWVGLIYEGPYPKRGAAARLLGEYARCPLFGTVGIDSTYYTPPTPKTLDEYAAALPEGFPCVSKVWNRLTIHTFNAFQDRARAGQENPDFLNPELFLEAIYEPCRAHFAGHAGPFVFELSPAGRRLAPEALAERLDGFFSQLPREGRYAVELRDEGALTPAYFAVLREHNVAHVLNSWSRMPSIGAQLDLPDVVTADFLVSRALLSPGVTYDESVDAFAPFDRIRSPDPALRADLLRLVELALALGIPAYVIVNNRTEGCSPLTIAALMSDWRGRRRG